MHIQIKKNTVPQLSLGHSPLRFSRLAYGAWRLNDGRSTQSSIDVAKLIQHCFELGITTFDHADIYGDYSCETTFGNAFAETGLKREQVQYVSKCGIKLISIKRPQHAIKSYDTSREHIVASVEQSLRNLRTDYLDLLLIHRPDPLMDPEEVASTFHDLEKSGKVRAFGVSNFTARQVEALASTVSMPLLTNQIEFSPLHLSPIEDGTLDQCLARRMTPMIWSPLAGGKLLTGTGERETRIRHTLSNIGQKHGGLTTDQVALAWIMRHPSHPIPVIGSGSLARIKAATDTCSVTLSREEWHTIWSAAMGKDVP